MTQTDFTLVFRKLDELRSDPDCREVVEEAEKLREQSDAVAEMAAAAQQLNAEPIYFTRA